MNNQQPQGQQPMQQQSVQPQMQPSNNNQPPKKKTNWGLIIGLLVGVFVLFFVFIFICVMLIFWIIDKNSDEIEYDSYDYNYESTYDSTEDDYTYDFNDGDTKKQTEDVIESDGEFQRVGNDVVGYIDVPVDYIEFIEAGGGSNGTMIQYSDMAGFCVVTLNSYNDISAEEAATNMYNHLTYNDEDIENVVGAEVVINGYQAYQVYGFYPSVDKTLVIWIFETPEENDYTHYLAIEFDEEHEDLFDVNETYSPVK